MNKQDIMTSPDTQAVLQQSKEGHTVTHETQHKTSKVVTRPSLLPSSEDLLCLREACMGMIKLLREGRPAKYEEIGNLSNVQVAQFFAQTSYTDDEIRSIVSQRFVNERENPNYTGVERGATYNLHALIKLVRQFRQNNMKKKNSASPAEPQPPRGKLDAINEEEECSTASCNSGEARAENWAAAQTQGATGNALCKKDL